MNWLSVGLTAASGGIAALLAWLIYGYRPENKAGYALVVGVLFLVLNIISKQFILPELNAHKAIADVESVLNDIPLFASIKKYEPATYVELANLLADARKQGYGQQQAIDLVGSQLQLLLWPRIAHASDQAILTYVSVMVTQMEELHRQGGGLCYKFLFPQIEGGIDGSNVLTQETQEMVLSALEEILKTSNAKKIIPSASEVMPSLDPIYENSYTKFGEDVSMMANPTAKNVDKDKLCSMTMDFYRSILQSTPDQAASALRWIFGQA